MKHRRNKIVFIDGGDNQLFARHAASRYRHRKTSKDKPLEVDAILVTHGDADHFDGLNKIVNSETDRKISERKRLFIYPKRIYHNGLVKSSSEGRKDEEMFGRTVPHQGGLAVVRLVNDPSDTDDVSSNDLNAPFKRWVKSIDRWKKHGPISLKRIAFGDKEDGLFDFLHQEGITVEIQGPFLVRPRDPENGLKRVDGLPLLIPLKNPWKSIWMTK